MMPKFTYSYCTYCFYLLGVFISVMDAQDKPSDTLTVGGRVMKYYDPNHLPNGMIALETYEGRKLQAEAKIINQYLVDRFTKQVNRRYCGPASIANTMNANNFGYHVKYQSVSRHSLEEKELEELIRNGRLRVRENDIIDAPNSKKCMNTATIAEKGATISQLALLIDCNGLGTETYFALSSNLNLAEKAEKLKDKKVFRNADEFRTKAMEILGKPLQSLIVNYYMELLGYEGYYGHFSPIAAYHDKTDMFLVMDVWPDTPPAWVPTTLLYNAMASVDSDSQLPRGMIQMYELLI